MADNELINDVGVLKGQVASLTLIASKLDVIIDKLVDQHDRHVSQIYKDMENRRLETESDIREIHDRIDTVLEKVQDTEKRISEKIEKLSKCVTEHNQKEKEQLDQILRWRWILLGGIVSIGWLLSHVGIDTILKSFR